MNSQILNPKSERGAALIIALAIMVLVMALVLGFLSRVKTERVAAGGYASSVSARLLADSATQVIQAQIDAATKQGINVAWSSQPGLIRTFSNAGAPLKSYKLYSSPEMQKDGALVPSTEAATLAGWFNKPAIYTDINMPVDTTGDGTPDIWPILDPSVLDLPPASAVQGFSITNAPTGTYLGISAANQRAPMPVAWLYILQDGQMVAPTENAGTAMVAGASKTNPIVGRIAFWTDDESCKINLNTASEGTYWDIPRFTTESDRDLGRFQPVKNEFQGYPGHPATVSLSAVFPALTKTLAADKAIAKDKYYSLTPRVQAGGSKNLTVLATDSITSVTLDQDRLYANVEELLFNNTRVASTDLIPAVLQRSKFFLTTTSRAPETNLYNLPKIVCWPLHTDAAAHRSAFDKLIAFCGTLNGLPYYFQRQNKDSSTEDAGIARNATLYSYLQKLTDLNTPGFGGTLSSKYGTDRNQILTEIFDYIRCTNLNDLNFADTTKQFAPGTGSQQFGQGQVMPITIGTTRGAGRYPTISEVALWFICTADPATIKSNFPDGGVTPAPESASVLPNLTLAAGTPLTIDTPPGTKQLRIEAALLLDPFTPMHGYVPMHPDVDITIEGLENLTIQGNSDTSAKNLGFPGVDRQTDGDAGVFRFATSPSYLGVMNTGGYMGTNLTMSGRQTRMRNGTRLPKDTDFDGSIDQSGVKNRQNPFVGEPVTITVTKTTPKMTIKGPPITITIKDRATGVVVQTIKMEFPSTVAPTPKLSLNKGWSLQQAGAGAGPAVTPLPKGRFGGDAPDVDRSGSLYDVIYSVVASRGGQTLDPRILAMTKDVDASMFNFHPKANSTNYFAHTLISNAISGFGGYVPSGATNGNGNTGTLAPLSAGQAYPWGFQPCPKVPYPATAAIANGDWDNGAGYTADGGFLNEPDQGNLALRTDTNTAFGYGPPYFSVHNKVSGFSSTFTSPSRMMPSSGMLGSLPTGVKRGLGWQTLLFRRQPTHPSYNTVNGGFINNPDYLFMDLFWMPVVEPYAISEPLSTAGKINMNTQIIPFTYIERTTGLYGVLKNEKVISVPTADYNGVYKNSLAPGNDYSPSDYRQSVKIPETLAQFNHRFNNTDGTGLYAFRTAAEICDMHIVPNNAAVNTANKATMDANMAIYWSGAALTGDNSRERIYTTIYPRLTTKSNTFTVYFRAQSLKQNNRIVDKDKWIEGKDHITGEYRGSTTIERYIDPNNQSIPDYASNPAASPSLDSLYHWRQREHRQFAP